MNLQSKNTLKPLAVWTFIWVISTAVASFGPKFLWDYNRTLSVIFILINLLIGVGMILANRKQVLAGDELQQKIQLESMGLTLGLTVVVGLAYSLLDISNSIQGDAEIGMLVLFIGITYIISIAVNTLKYK
jgi:hypothetical protein